MPVSHSVHSSGAALAGFMAVAVVAVAGMVALRKRAAAAAAAVDLDAVSVFATA